MTYSLENLEDFKKQSNWLQTQRYLPNKKVIHHIQSPKLLNDSQFP